MRSCDQKLRAFFEEFSWFKFNNLGLAVGMALKFGTSVTKRVKTKSQKVFGANSKTGRGDFLAPHHPE